MKAGLTLTNISAQLRPSRSKPNPGLLQLRPTYQLAAFHQLARSQRPFARALQQQPLLHYVQLRNNSTSVAPLTSAIATKYPPEQDQVPTYELTFTCKPCLHRSTHRVSHQGYNHGTVLIKCPSCKNRHVMADHLKVFEDKAFTIEDLMREKGEQFKRGTVEGDIEFWDDGTKTERMKS